VNPIVAFCLPLLTYILGVIMQNAACKSEIAKWKKSSQTFESLYKGYAATIQRKGTVTPDNPDISITN
jgi:hypothetical protein